MTLTARDNSERDASRLLERVRWTECEEKNKQTTSFAKKWIGKNASPSVRPEIDWLPILTYQTPRPIHEAPKRKQESSQTSIIRYFSKTISFCCSWRESFTESQNRSASNPQMDWLLLASRTAAPNYGRNQFKVKLLWRFQTFHFKRYARCVNTTNATERTSVFNLDFRLTISGRCVIWWQKQQQPVSVDEGDYENEMKIVMLLITR